MPTITIRNGNRTLKLTKRERDILTEAKDICSDIDDDFDPLRPFAGDAAVSLGGVLDRIGKDAANGKPAAKQPE